MNPRKAVKELDKQLRRDPGNLVLRIRLAGALHANGQVAEAVELYRSVAVAYYAQSRIDQAIAVCYSLLEIAPEHQDTHLLLAELNSRRAAIAPPEPEPEPERPPDASAPREAAGGKRRPRRTSGFDSLTPGSAPDILNPPRSSRSTKPPDPQAITGRVGGTSGLQRFPLPQVRTVSGHTPGRSRTPSRGPSSASPTPTPSSTAGTAPHRRGAPPDSPGQVDEEAPTRIADRWLVPVVARPTPTPVGRTNRLGRTDRNSEPPPPSAVVVPPPPEDSGTTRRIRRHSQQSLRQPSESDAFTNPHRGPATATGRRGRATLPRGSGRGRPTRMDSEVEGEMTVYDEGA